MKQILLLALLGHEAFTEGKVRCDFETLTNHCAVLSQTAPLKIKMADGTTFIPNLAALSRVQSQQSQDQGKHQKESQEKIENATSQARFAIANVLDEVPSKLMSAGFKASLLQAKDLLLASVLNDPLSDAEKYSTPWPPNSNSGQIIKVDPSSFRQKIRNILTPNQLKRISTALEKLEEIDAESDEFNAASANPLGFEANQVVPERKKRVEELVELARRSDIHSLVGDKPKSEWSQAQAAAVARLQTITYNSGEDETVASNPTCKGLNPNAFYSRLTHSINICPNAYNLPDVSLIQLLGHEIGHSVDPCGAQSPVFKIDPSKFGAHPGPEFSADKDMASLWKNTKLISDQGIVHTGINLTENAVDPRSMDKFVQTGALVQETPTPPSIKQTSEGLDGYILSDVYSCLLSEAGGGLRQQTQAQIESLADLVVARRKSIADATYDAENDRKAIISAYLKFPQCRLTEVQSQMREAVADWFSSRALEDYMKTHPPKTSMDRLATVAVIASDLCMLRDDVKKSSEARTAGDTSDGIDPILKRVNDAHPDDKQRIDRVILANPKLLENMGCEKSSFASCQHQIDGNLRSSDNTKTESTK